MRFTRWRGAAGALAISITGALVLGMRAHAADARGEALVQAMAQAQSARSSMSDAAATRSLPTTTTARKIEVPQVQESVGTVRAAHRAQIAARTMARVVEVLVRAGDRVKVGDVLVRLDDIDAAARLAQARAAVAQASAGEGIAVVTHRRIANLFADRAATRQELDQAASQMNAAQAQVQQSTAAVHEAAAALSYTVVQTPIAGLVVEKRVQPGDLAVPGQPLVTLEDPSALQVEAGFPEALAAKLSPGTAVRVVVPAIDLVTSGAIVEVVPAADPVSRQVFVKASLGANPRLRPGMFARVLLDVGRRQLLVVPRSAVRVWGQIESVEVVESGRPGTRMVRTGKVLGDDVEILSGLEPGETIIAGELR